jgi:LysR family hydrogen peroxide-inducible transcriptional activator
MQTFRQLPKLTQLRHLITLSEHCHFGKAAESCFITQSSLSTSIKELESILGGVLVERTRRSVIMTTLGEEVVKRAHKVVTDVEDLTDLVNAEREPLTGTLRLGAIPTIAPYLLPQVLPQIRAAYPDLKLYLREERSADLVKHLISGELDLLILAFPYPTPDLETMMIANDPFWVAYPPGRSNANRTAVKPKSLKNEPLLVLEEGNCLRDHVLSACHLNTKSENVDFQASSLHTLIQMVDNDLGVTLIPEMAINAGIATKTGTTLLPLEGIEASRDIGFVWRPTSARKQEISLLAKFFSNELKSAPIFTQT